MKTAWWELSYAILKSYGYDKVTSIQSAVKKPNGWSGETAFTLRDYDEIHPAGGLAAGFSVEIHLTAGRVAVGESSGDASFFYVTRSVQVSASRLKWIKLLFIGVFYQ